MKANLTNYRKEFMSKEDIKFSNRSLYDRNNLYIDIYDYTEETIDSYYCEPTNMKCYNIVKYDTIKHQSNKMYYYNKMTSIKGKLKLPLPKDDAKRYKEELYHSLKKKYTDYQINNQLIIYLVKYDNGNVNLEYELLEG